MQLWALWKSPVKMCCLSAATSSNNTLTITARRTAPPQIIKNAYFIPNNQRNTAHFTRSDRKTSQSPWCTNRIREAAFDILWPLQRCLTEYSNIIIKCYFCECLPVNRHSTQPSPAIFKFRKLTNEIRSTRSLKKNCKAKKNYIIRDDQRMNTTFGVILFIIWEALSHMDSICKWRWRDR